MPTLAPELGQEFLALAAALAESIGLDRGGLGEANVDANEVHTRLIRFGAHSYS